MIFEELYAGLSLFIVLLLIKVGNFLLNYILDYVQYSKVMKNILFTVLVSLVGLERSQGFHFLKGLFDFLLFILDS